MPVSENTFVVPNRTNSDFGEGKILWDLFRQVAQWVHDCKSVSCLDFGSVVHLKPYAVALVIILAKRLAVADMRIVEPRDETARSHLIRLGVPTILGVNWGEESARQTNLPLEHLMDRPSPDFSFRTATLLESEFSGGLPPGFKAKVADSIDEVILNALAHSESECGCVVVGQAFPKKQCIEVAIVDLGITIHRHLSRRYPHLTTDEEAIREAVKEGITGTPVGNLNRLGDPNSGVGLSELKEFVEKTDGELAILSGSELVCFGLEDKSQPLMGQRFTGTLVNIRFNTGMKTESQSPKKTVYYQ